MISDNIARDIVKAMKAREKDRLAVLRYVKSALRNREIDLGRKLSDKEMMSELQTQVKKREQALDLYRQGGRDELADKEAFEIKVISSYLPRPLSSEEMEQEVDLALKELEAASMSDMGKTMKYLKEKLGTRADGKILSTIVRQRLSS